MKDMKNKSIILQLKKTQKKRAREEELNRKTTKLTEKKTINKKAISTYLSIMTCSGN